MSFTLQDKVAIGTGSGSGIGKATATVLAERGASVVIADINPTAEHAIPQLRHSLVPRPGQPEDIAYAVAFLMSDEAAFITGITIPVDGGLTVHFPSYAEELDAQSGKTAGVVVSAVDASPITPGTPIIYETLQTKEM
jgi:NAD(P)-dependent dehydrogenase (short-subunit alcohol dehydrogenase family)